MMGLLTAMLSLLFSAERAKPIQLLLWFCHADPARRHVIPPSLVTKTSAHLPRIVSNNEKKPKEKWKRRMWQEKQQGWSFRSWTATAFASSRSSLRCRRAAQEHRALGSEVATNHTWRRALRLSCLLAATAGPAQPPARLTSTACLL